MFRTLHVGVAALALAAVPALAQAAKYSIKEVESPPPKELAEPVREVLGDRAIQLLDEQGNVVGEVWFRKVIPADATPAQVKNGLTYREIPETTLLGALKVSQQMADYRKQKIAPGVYTLRLAFQPQDGDHMGTSPYPEFGLLLSASDDKSPKPMESVEEMQQLSAKASGRNHPAIFLLHPNEEPKGEPRLVSKGLSSWVLFLKRDAKAGDQKATLGIGLTLVGTSPAA